jgi:hypothetical protein
MSGHHVGPATNFSLSTDIVFRPFFYGCPLWQEDGSVTYLYKCYWASPALSLSGPSFVELRPYLTVSFETGFPFCCLLQLAGITWKYSNLPPRGLLTDFGSCLPYISPGGPNRRHRLTCHWGLPFLVAMQPSNSIRKCPGESSISTETYLMPCCLAPTASLFQHWPKHVTIWQMLFGILHCVALVRTDVLENMLPPSSGR